MKDHRRLSSLVLFSSCTLITLLANSVWMLIQYEEKNLHAKDTNQCHKICQYKRMHMLPNKTVQLIWLPTKFAEWFDDCKYNSHLINLPWCQLFYKLSNKAKSFSVTQEQEAYLLDREDQPRNAYCFPLLILWKPMNWSRKWIWPCECFGFSMLQMSCYRSFICTIQWLIKPSWM